MGHSLSSKSQLNAYHSKHADLECYVSIATILSSIKRAKTKLTLSTTLGILYTNFVKRNTSRRKIKSGSRCCLTQDVMQHSFIKVLLDTLLSRQINLLTGVQRLAVLGLPSSVN